MLRSSFARSKARRVTSDTIQAIAATENDTVRAKTRRSLRRKLMVCLPPPATRRAGAMRRPGPRRSLLPARPPHRLQTASGTAESLAEFVELCFPLETNPRQNYSQALAEAYQST